MGGVLRGGRPDLKAACASSSWRPAPPVSATVSPAPGGWPPRVPRSRTRAGDDRVKPLHRAARRSRRALRGAGRRGVAGPPRAQAACRYCSPGRRGRGRRGDRQAGPSPPTPCRRADLGLPRPPVLPQGPQLALELRGRGADRLVGEHNPPLRPDAARTRPARVLPRHPPLPARPLIQLALPHALAEGNHGFAFPRPLPGITALQRTLKPQNVLSLDLSRGGLLTHDRQSGEANCTRCQLGRARLGSRIRAPGRSAPGMSRDQAPYAVCVSTNVPARLLACVTTNL